jgi:hypothetical protein
MKQFLLSLVLFLSFVSLLANSELEKKQLRSKVEEYFEVWSMADIDSYGKLFHESAVIFYRDKYSGKIEKESLKLFLENQKRAHEISTQKMSEIPIEIKIYLHGKNTAQVTVYWKLQKGKEIIYGWDYFTWIKVAEEWKILTLFFYSE